MLREEGLECGREGVHKVGGVGVDSVRDFIFTYLAMVEEFCVSQVSPSSVRSMRVFSSAIAA